MNTKNFEILEALPVYGPMYIPVTENSEPYFSEGFVVRFCKSDGTDWVANFQQGWTSLKTVYELADTFNLLVIAGGVCYIMNPNQTKPISVFGMDYTQIFQIEDGRLILQGSTDLTIIERNGEHWDSERISWDGLKDIKLDKNIISGLSYTPMNGAENEWVEFVYNIDTKTLIGGSYYEFDKKKKSWWKIWI